MIQIDDDRDVSAPTALLDGSRDFDFLHGRWRVEHRRLKERLYGCTEWDSFTGQCHCFSVLGGQGNIDDNSLDLPAGSYRATTIRSFDPASQTWSIWWLDARYPHSLGVPIVGSFADGVGDFYADDTHNGAPARLRFRWTTGVTPIWEQALSNDNGASWEVNWTMRFIADQTISLT